VKDRFDSQIASVIAKIPSSFDFSEGEANNNIGDGGKDMFDGGNFLGTEIEADFDYSNDVITSTGAFGEGSRFFTKKYPGAIFVLAADNKGANEFTVYSNYGADGEGQSGIHSFEYKGFTGHFLKVWGSPSASINKLFIHPDNNNV
jgi:hypothetical protein